MATADGLWTGRRHDLFEPTTFTGAISMTTPGAPSRGRVAFLALVAALMLGWLVLGFVAGTRQAEWLMFAAVALNLGDAVLTTVRGRRGRSRTTA